MSNIYIFSRAIRTGKTTELTEWIATQNGIAGILAPDIYGKRKIFNIQDNKYYDLELNKENEDSIKVGKFIFDEKIFKIIQKILQNLLINPPNWLIIDEIGKLELLENKGLEPAISKVIEHYKSHNGKLLLVIRDTLLHQAIVHYKLNNYIVINNLKELL